MCKKHKMSYSQFEHALLLTTVFTVLLTAVNIILLTTFFTVLLTAVNVILLTTVFTVLLTASI